MDDTTDDYVRTLETEISNKNEQLKDYAKVIHELYQEARPGHLDYIRRTYGTSIMAEHALGKEKCEVCRLLMAAKGIYSREGINNGSAKNDERMAG